MPLELRVSNGQQYTLPSPHKKITSLILHEVQPLSLPPMPTTWSINHKYDDHGKKQCINDLLKGTNATTWWGGLDNELGHLSSGLQNSTIVGTNTIDYMKREDIPKAAAITYTNTVCDEQPLKPEKHRVYISQLGKTNLHFKGIQVVLNPIFLKPS